MRRVFILFCLTLNTGLFAYDLPPLPKKDSVQLLLELARSKFDYEPLTSLSLATRALDYAQESGFKKGEAKALWAVAKSQYILHRNEEALSTYQKAAALYRQLGESESEGLCYNAIANVYIYKLNNDHNGYLYCNKAKGLLKDSTNIQGVFANIAALHLQTNRLDDALGIYMQVGRHWQTHGNLSALAIALNNIAAVYEKKNDYERSIEYYEKALAIHRDLKSTRQSAYVAIGLSAAYCSSGKHQRAEKILSEVVDETENTDLHLEHSNAVEYLAEERMHLGKDKIGFPLTLTLIAVSVLVVSVVGIMRARKPKEIVTTTTENKIEVMTGGGLTYIDISSVWWFNKEERNTIAFDNDQTYRVKETISELETIVPSDKFFKINRAVIVNIEHIDNYSFWEHHKYIIRMSDVNKTEFVITRKRLHELKEVWKAT